MAAQHKAFAVTSSATPSMTLHEVSTAYAAVMTELEKLKKNGAKRNQKGGTKGKNKRQKGSKTETAEKTGKCDFYTCLCQTLDKKTDIKNGYPKEEVLPPPGTDTR